MESISEDRVSGAEAGSMDIELQRIPRRKEVLNLLTGIFLKSVYFLDPELTKCVIVGFVKNRGNSLGVLFKGRKGAVFLTHNTFNQFAVHFNEITMALEKRGKIMFREDDFEIKLSNVFGRQHIFLYDGEHTLTLNTAEWTQFVNNLPSMYRELRNRFLQEDLIINYIVDILASDEDFVTPPEGLSPYQGDRLFDEVQLFKRWPNGGSG